MSFARAGEERRRISAYHEGWKYVRTFSNKESSCNFITDSKERLQVLHHCYTYGQNKCLHVARDSGQILSIVLIVINKNLLKAYRVLLKQIYEMVLNPLYIPPISCGQFFCLSDLAINERERLELAIKDNDKLIVDFDTLKQWHML